MRADTQTPSSPGTLAPVASGVDVGSLQAVAACVQQLMLELQDDPDDLTVDRALGMLAKLRTELEASDLLRKLVTDLRGKLFAQTISAAPQITVKRVAEAAGFGDSYGARVANTHGAGRRRSKWEEWARLVCEQNVQPHAAAKQVGISATTLRRYRARLATQGTAPAGAAARAGR